MQDTNVIAAPSIEHFQAKWTRIVHGRLKAFIFSLKNIRDFKFISQKYIVKIQGHNRGFRPSTVTVLSAKYTIGDYIVADGFDFVLGDCGRQNITI